MKTRHHINCTYLIIIIFFLTFTTLAFASPNAQLIPDTIILGTASGGWQSYYYGYAEFSFDQDRYMPPVDQMYVEYKTNDPFCTSQPWQKLNTNRYPVNWYNDTITHVWRDSSGGLIHSSEEILRSGCHASGVDFRIVYLSYTGTQTAYAVVSNVQYHNGPLHLTDVNSTMTGNTCVPMNVIFNLQVLCYDCDGSSSNDISYYINFEDGTDTSFIHLAQNHGYYNTTLSHTYNSTGTFHPTFHVANVYGSGNDTLTLAINLPSAIITTSGSTTFCSGHSAVLNAPINNYRTYQWKKGGNNIAGATVSNYTASIGGVYKVTVTNTMTGCSKTSTPGTVVTVNASPNAVITPQGPTTFCAGGNVILSANTGGGLTYQWKKGGTDIAGATSVNYTATIGGVYKVREVNSYGCAKLSTGVVVSIPCREEDELTEINGSISLYPNPTSGKFTIQSPTGKISQITVTNLSGQTILKKDFQNHFNSPIEIDLTNQSKGIYLIQVITGKEVYNQKIILE